MGQESYVSAATSRESSSYFKRGGVKKKRGGGGPQIMSTEAVILCKYSPDMQLISLA